MAAAPDPWSAGFMALGSIAQAGKSSPTSANQQSTATFDNSNWNVVIGGGQASNTKTAMPGISQVAGAVAASAGSLLSNPVFIIGVGAALFLALKHK